jgi:hypothetical protein
MGVVAITNTANLIDHIEKAVSVMRRFFRFRGALGWFQVTGYKLQGALWQGSYWPDPCLIGVWYRSDPGLVGDCYRGGSR